MTQADFHRALREVYQENPCQVLPGPLWQTLAGLADCETSVARGPEGVNRLEAFTNDSLLIYWRRSGRQPSMLINRRLEYQRFALIHQDFLDPPTVAGFKAWESRYRLIYRPETSTEVSLPDGYRFQAAVDSAGGVAALQGHVAQAENPALDFAQDWLNSPAFAPDLLLWLLDERNEQPVGLGVALLDSDLGEAVIEQVQIVEAYRGRGLGRALVQELLRRIGTRASFTTVSGIVEDRDNPGAFFRHCGFAGDDVWWWLRR